MKIDRLTGTDTEVLRCYSRGHGWCDAYITELGQFTAQSDYGTFGYWWGSPGTARAKPADTKLMVFVAFLLGIETNPDYFVIKLTNGRDSQFDAETTEKAVKERLIEARRDDSMSAEDAREEWDSVDGRIDDEAAFVAWSASTSLDDPHELAHYEVNRRDGDAFAGRVLIPELVPALREWLEAERTRRTPLAQPEEQP